MAVDFPNNPSRDELFFAEGTTWKWTGVAWAIVGGDGTPTEIVGADTSAGWQVWGDVLIQWGFANTDGTGNGNVAFPKAFKNNLVRVFTDTYVTNAIYDVVVHTTSILAGGFNFIGGFNGGFAGVNVQWFAIGEAKDEDKKAKVVHSANGESAGGGGASVVVGEVPPENPSQGDMWFATGESVGLYVWYGDEDSSQWVMTNGGGRALNAVQRTGDTMTGDLIIDGAGLTVKGPLVVEGASAEVKGNVTFTAPQYIVQPDASDTFDHARYYFRNKAGVDRVLTYLDNTTGDWITQVYDAAGAFKSAMKYYFNAGFGGVLQADTLYATSKLISNGTPNNAGRVGTREGGTVNFGYVLRASHLALQYQIDASAIETVVTNNNANFLGYVGNTGGPTGVSCNGYDNAGQLYGTFVDGVSDERIKQNIAPTQLNALDLINSIEMVEYDYTPEYMATLTGDTWKDTTPDQHVKIGLVTQQLKTLVPEAVHENPHKALDIDDLQTWSPEALVPYLIKAVQQLTARVEELENANGT